MRLTRAFLLLSGVALPALLPDHALAGAWLLEAGRAEIIFSQAYTEAGSRFDRRGRALAADRFRKGGGTVDGAFGVSPGLTLLARARLDAVAMHGATGKNHAAIGGLGAGARVRLWSDDSQIVSLQAMAHGQGERSLPGNLRSLEAPVEVDFRLQYGRSFALGGMSGFTDAQLGYRWRGAGNADEIRLDATAGIRPLPGLLVMLQSFNTFSVSDDRRFGGGRLRQHKIQPSLVYQLSDNWSVQAGVFVSVAGRETIRERGAVIALLWRR